jgi:intein/homing endonuclease
MSLAPRVKEVVDSVVVQQSAREHGGFERVEYIEPLAGVIEKKTGSIKLRAQSCEMIEKLKSYDINPSLKCHNKITPKLIWKSTKETQSNYLSGLFDGSGSITNRTISLTSTSLKLIQETQLLLLNMGFHPNITKIDGKKKLKTAIKNKKLLPQGKEVKKNRDAWSLDISRTEFRKFAEEIGFRIKKNQIKLIELSKKYNQDNFNLKTIPTSIVFDTIKNLFNKSLKTKKWFKDNNLRLDKVLKNKKNSVITTKWLSLFRTLLKTANVAETREDTLFFENVTGNL